MSQVVVLRDSDTIRKLQAAKEYIIDAGGFRRVTYDHVINCALTEFLRGVNDYESDE